MRPGGAFHIWDVTVLGFLPRKYQSGCGKYYPFGAEELELGKKQKTRKRKNHNKKQETCTLNTVFLKHELIY